MTDGAAFLRRRNLTAALVCLMGFTACGGVQPVVRDVDGLPCVTFRKTHRPSRICAAQPSPPAEVAREVQAFSPDPASAQVLVQWVERAGATRALTLRVDGRPVAELVPGGLVRLRLTPGAHELSVAWRERQAALPVQAGAGDVQFAEVVGRLEFRDSSFVWEAADAAGARRRAASARVTADVDLRVGPGKAGGGGAPTP